MPILWAKVSPFAVVVLLALCDHNDNKIHYIQTPVCLLIIQMGWSEFVHKLLIFWDFFFFRTTITKKCLKREDYLVSCTCEDENALLMSGVRGQSEWTHWLETIDLESLKKPGYNQDEQTCISACLNLKQCLYMHPYIYTLTGLFNWYAVLACST